MLYLNDCLIVARSSTVKSQLTSSCEGESHGIFEACKSLIFIDNWLKCLPFINIPKPSFIFNDNKAAVLLMSNPGCGSRSKHFDVKLRFVAHNIEAGIIQVRFLRRGLNAADILTHSLSRADFENGLIHLLGERGANQIIQGGRWLRSGGESEFTSECTRIEVLEILSTIRQFSM